MQSVQARRPHHKVMSYDPRKVKVHRTPTPRDVPYVPSDDNVVLAMLRLAGATASDVVCDLGCGDGRIVITAAKRLGCRGIGVDIDPERIEECRENARRAAVTDRVTFLCESFFDVDLRGVTVVMMYLLPGINARLRPKLLAELPTGARIICNHFDMGDWPADEVLHAHGRTLRKWIIPAPITGQWHCTVNDPAGRRHLRLTLERRYQVVTGRAFVAGREVMISNGRIDGDRLTFRVVEWGRGGKVMRYAGKITDHSVRGRCWEEGQESAAGEWGGTRAT